MDLGQAINILIIASSAASSTWRAPGSGALVFALIDNYSAARHFGDFIGAAPERFNTVIGGLFLLIVLLSPGGIIGIGLLDRRLRQAAPRRRAGPPTGDRNREPGEERRDASAAERSNRRQRGASYIGADRDTVACTRFVNV